MLYICRLMAVAIGLFALVWEAAGLSPEFTVNRFV
jgi:hypothetical protein